MSKTILISIAVIIIIAVFFMTRSELKVSKPVEEQPTAKDFPHWREFRSVDDHFKTMLPSPPQQITKHIKDPDFQEMLKYDTYISVDESSGTFMISAITYPEEIKPDGIEALLKNVVDNMLKRNQENQLKKTEVNQFHHHKAMDFMIENEEATIIGKVLTKNNIVYVLVLIKNISSETSNKPYDYFINSFTFLDEDKKI